MADEKLLVFLSHTSELRAHPAGRSFVDAAESAVLKVGWLPVDMKHFAAQDQNAAAASIEAVEKADILVGLVGFRWGSAVSDEPDKSYTELEFDAASRRRPPLTRLMFLLAGDRVLPIPFDQMRDANSARQEAFRKRVMQEGLIVSTVAGPDELEVALLHALTEEKARRRSKAEAERTRIGPATSAGAVRLLTHPADVERRAWLAGVLNQAGFIVSAGDGDGPLVVGATYKAVATGLLGGSQLEPGPFIIVELDEDLAIAADTTRVRAYDGTPETIAGRLREALAPFLPPEPAEPITPVAVSSEPVTGPDALDQLTDELDFDTGHIASFRADLRPERLSALPAVLSDRQFLESCALMSGGRLTRAGVLLFGRQPERVLPTALVQCTHYFGTERAAARESEHMHGPIAHQIERARQFVADRTGEGSAAAYPMIAVREVLANALVHRDYEDRERTVHVRLFADRLEISSPGAWAGRTLPDEQAQDLRALAGESRKRNFRLASALTWVKLVEGEGSGIPTAVADCAELDAPEPVVVRQDGFVKVVLRPSRSGAPGGRSGPVWNIPARTANFVGRDDLLDKIGRAFASAASSVLVLHGDQGTGKTTTAKEFAHRHAGDYDVAWWVSANDPAPVDDQLAALARTIRPESAETRPDLGEALSGQRSLLVLDDIENPAEVLSRLPAEAGHVLITSQHGGRVGAAAAITVGRFGRAESIALLRSRDPELTVGQADRIAAAKGDLPREVESVVDFLGYTGLSADDYLAQAARAALDEMPGPGQPGPVD
uniref:ATP-binding protein n=1 Tax=Paractinoplanes polyasparticus TaxID=2856853 RepID=UPI0027E0BD7E|nr:ATP-binding protein [Actinoplanes polyasparticus]